jgi:hypothetical protein
MQGHGAHVIFVLTVAMRDALSRMRGRCQWIDSFCNIGEEPCCCNIEEAPCVWGAVFSGKKHNVLVRDFLLAISCMGGIFFLCGEGLWEFLF